MRNRFFHGTRAELTCGDLIGPVGGAHVFLSISLDGCRPTSSKP
jgi:hypothetical protein